MSLVSFHDKECQKCYHTVRRYINCMIFPVGDPRSSGISQAICKNCGHEDTSGWEINDPMDE